MSVPFIDTWIANGPFAIVQDTEVSGGYSVVLYNSGTALAAVQAAIPDVGTGISRRKRGQLIRAIQTVTGVNDWFEYDGSSFVATPSPNRNLENIYGFATPTAWEPTISGGGTTLDLGAGALYDWFGVERDSPGNYAPGALANNETYLLRLDSSTGTVAHTTALTADLTLIPVAIFQTDGSGLIVSVTDLRWVINGTRPSADGVITVGNQAFAPDEYANFDNINAAILWAALFLDDINVPTRIMVKDDVVQSAALTTTMPPMTVTFNQYRGLIIEGKPGSLPEVEITGASLVNDAGGIIREIRNLRFDLSSATAGAFQVSGTPDPAPLVFKNCTFEGGTYIIHGTGAAIALRDISFEECNFRNLNGAIIGQTDAVVSATSLSIVVDKCTIDSLVTARTQNVFPYGMLVNISGSPTKPSVGVLSMSRCSIVGTAFNTAGVGIMSQCVSGNEALIRGQSVTSFSNCRFVDNDSSFAGDFAEINSCYMNLADRILTGNLNFINGDETVVDGSVATILTSQLEPSDLVWCSQTPLDVTFSSHLWVDSITNAGEMEVSQRSGALVAPNFTANNLSFGLHGGFFTRDNATLVRRISDSTFIKNSQIYNSGSMFCEKVGATIFIDQCQFTDISVPALGNVGSPEAAFAFSSWRDIGGQWFVSGSKMAPLAPWFGSEISTNAYGKPLFMDRCSISVNPGTGRPGTNPASALVRVALARLTGSSLRYVAESTRPLLLVSAPDALSSSLEGQCLIEGNSLSSLGGVTTNGGVVGFFSSSEKSVPFIFTGNTVVSDSNTSSFTNKGLTVQLDAGADNAPVSITNNIFGLTQSPANYWCGVSVNYGSISVASKALVIVGNTGSRSVDETTLTFVTNHGGSVLVTNNLGRTGTI